MLLSVFFYHALLIVLRVGVYGVVPFFAPSGYEVSPCVRARCDEGMSDSSRELELFRRLARANNWEIHS